MNHHNYFQQNNVFGTGVSDFYMMVVEELKMGFQKLKPHIVACLYYKNFDNENILKCFKETVFCILSKHTPIKIKYVRANEAP